MFDGVLEVRHDCRNAEYFCGNNPRSTAPSWASSVTLTEVESPPATMSLPLRDSSVLRAGPHSNTSFRWSFKKIRGSITDRFSSGGERPNVRSTRPIMRGQTLPFKVASGPISTVASATQCGSNPVSGRRLLKTGIFRISAGDYLLFPAGIGQIRDLETVRRIAKARHWRPFLALLRVKSPVAGLVGWGGRIRTPIWRIGAGCTRLSEMSRRTSFG
jgi:hypothetical protein